MSLTMTISSCLSPGRAVTCSRASSRIPAVNSADISATRSGVRCRPGLCKSSPTPSSIRRTPRSILSRSTSRGGKSSGPSSGSVAEYMVAILEASFSESVKGRARRILHCAQRHRRFQRGLAALFVFGRRADDATAQARDLDRNPTELRLDSHGLPLKRAPQDAVAAHAERRRFGEEEFEHRLAVFGPTKNRDEHAGTVLLHLRLRKVAVERAARERLLQDVSEDLRRHVVNVRLDDRQLLVPHSAAFINDTSRGLGFADEHAQNAR